MKTIDVPTDRLNVPTTWRSATLEAERTSRADGSARIVLTVLSETTAGQQDFTIGLCLPPEALVLALTGLDGQPCEVRVSDVVDVEEASS